MPVVIYVYMSASAMISQSSRSLLPLVMMPPYYLIVDLIFVNAVFSSTSGRILVGLLATVCCAKILVGLGCMPSFLIANVIHMRINMIVPSI